YAFHSFFIFIKVIISVYFSNAKIFLSSLFVKYFSQDIFYGSINKTYSYISTPALYVIIMAYYGNYYA
ncbi:MAG: hypothetical protein II226_08820, partial [Alistipes sp.]|nr:hypothetical protein [Alistipes sp.]